mmetsp:Transcript_106953/g.228386  ORF Transcript_106953/g.228386 Transcript_106953/m.228386 type:complete len:209 (-) Transcript_106953:632-1258(-)
MRSIPEHCALSRMLQLHDVGCSGAEDTNTPLPATLHSSLRGPTVRIGPRTSSETLSHIEGRAIIVIAVDRKSIADIDRGRGPRSHRVDRVIAEVGIVLRCTDAKAPVGAPHAAATVELMSVFTITINFSEVQLSHLWLPKSPVNCHRTHRLTEEKVLSVVKVNLTDYEHVGNNADMVIRDPLGYPDGAFASGVRQYVEHEGFVRIADH